MKNRIISISAMVLAVVALFVTIGGLVIFYRQVATPYRNTTDKSKYYNRTYAFITKDRGNVSWDPIYDEMLVQADKGGSFVEMMGKDLSVPYTEGELMDIAIASKVDGIILEGDGSDAMNNEINLASEAGIPVVTVWDDAVGSSRISYVGMSYYNLGSEYGKLVSNAVIGILNDNASQKKDNDNAFVNAVLLIEKGMYDSSQNMILLGIQDELSHSSMPAGVLNMEIKSITNEGDFSAEEQIRDILAGHEIPDIVICLNQVSTLSVYQTIVEKNMVGSTIIIGYSDSDTVLKAIEKNNIYATITVDGEQMAKRCVDALDDYLKYGRTSDYYSVDFTCIDAGNVAEYERHKNEE